MSSLQVIAINDAGQNSPESESDIQQVIQFENSHFEAASLVLHVGREVKD